ncbi:MAG: enoyl-CoA hydratase/isomerase family protein, partial [Deltaproteobacteria bacterium]|nr:enoyl-CoA hydratase/isomerase family protein [Deltaproteobacteria bacterium]
NGAVFSAGLELPALVGRTRAEMQTLITLFDRVMLRFFELPIPLIAAIDGHAIAGGTVLALQADLRLAADKPLKMGLNETQLGIGLPAIVLETLRAQVPASSLAPIAIEGKLFNPQEAHALGLVHEVLPADQLLPKAIERATALAALSPAGVRQVKAALRRPTAQAIRATEHAETERWLETWFHPESQRVLQAAVAKLKK